MKLLHCQNKECEGEDFRIVQPSRRIDCTKCGHIIGYVEKKNHFDIKKFDAEETAEIAIAVQNQLLFLRDAHAKEDSPHARAAIKERAVRAQKLLKKVQSATSRSVEDEEDDGEEDAD